MTTTTTEPSVLEVLVELVGLDISAESRQVVAEIRAATEKIRPLIERASALAARSAAIENAHEAEFKEILGPEVFLDFEGWGLVIDQLTGTDDLYEAIIELSDLRLLYERSETGPAAGPVSEVEVDAATPEGDDQ